jgi:hypothetical protein
VALFTVFSHLIPCYEILYFEHLSIFQARVSNLLVGLSDQVH